MSKESSLEVKRVVTGEISGETSGTGKETNDQSLCTSNRET